MHRTKEGCKEKTTRQYNKKAKLRDLKSPILSSSLSMVSWAACSSLFFTDSLCWVSDNACSSCSFRILRVETEKKIHQHFSFYIIVAARIIMLFFPHSIYVCFWYVSTDLRALDSALSWATSSAFWSAAVDLDFSSCSRAFCLSFSRWISERRSSLSRSNYARYTEYPVTT